MRLDGVAKTLANINLKIMVLSGDMERITMNAGRLIERRAKENISGQHGHDRHIITGNLRNSIDTKVHKRGINLYQAEIGTDVRYALPVEVRSPDGGYLRPSLSETKPQVMNYISRTICGEIGLL